MSSQTTPRVRGRLKSVLAISLASLTVALWGCGGTSPQASVSHAKTLTSLSIAPSNPVIALGDNQQLTVTGNYSDGSTQNMTNSVTWSVSPSGVATVSAAGLAHTEAKGTATLTATSGSVSGNDKLTVSSAALVSIAVTPSDATVPKGETQQLTATGTFSDGSTENITNSVAWSASPTGVATVSSAGLALLRTTGTATVTATAGSISGSDTLTGSGAVLVSIAVTPSNPTVPKGETQQLTATGTFSDGSTQNITSTVAWAASSSGVATVNTTGLLNAQAVGTTGITAVSGSINGADTVTVGSPVVVAIAVIPANPSVALGFTQQFKATGTYSDGTTGDVTPTVTWTAAAPTVAKINASGLAATLQVGTSGVTATSGSVAGSTSLSVTQHVLVSIAISPASTSIPLGGAAQLDAVGTFSDGTTADVTQTSTWSSAQPLIASAAYGLVASKAMGTTAISALSGSVTGSAALTVSAPALYSIAVTPLDPNVAIAGTVQLVATGNFTNGTTQNLTNSVAWSAYPAGVASVSSTGLATGLTAGTTTIYANQNNINGTDAIVVALSSMTITPSTSTVAVGNGLALQAIGTFSNGSTGDVTNSVTWVSATPSVAAVNGTGFATALATGTTNVSASSGSQTATAAITVVPVVDLTYFANANTPGVASAVVNVSNPGSTGGSLCAMFYVFDASEEMNSCCGCSVSPDDLRTLLVDSNLTGNPLAGAALTRGVIEIVPADITSNPTCNPTSITPLGELATWSTHTQNVSPGSYAPTESAFYPALLGKVNLANLQTTCSFVQSLGSGGGVCSCGTGE
jgi:trimeric autotransporter adhesin